MTEKLPRPKTVHTGRISHQDTHPDLLTPAAIRAALIKAGITPASAQPESELLKILASARAMTPEDEV